MSAKIQIVEVESREVLIECSLEDAEIAYEAAAQFEAQGVDVELIKPGAPESLVECLGISDREKSEYRKSLKEEIDSHNDDDSCCHT